MTDYSSPIKHYQHVGNRCLGGGDPFYLQTEVSWFDSHTNIKKLRDHELSVRVGPEKITPVRAIRDIGVQLDE